MSGAHPELSRVNWYGLKRIIKRTLAFGPVNVPLLKLINATPPLRRRTNRFPVGLSHVACKVDAGETFLMLDPLSCSVAKDVYWGSGRRGMPEDRVAAGIFETLAIEADWILDIGAYTGFFSLLACTVNRRVRAIAFEIVPETYLLLWRNIIHNDLVARIDARLQGLGATGDSMIIPDRLNLSELPSSISRGYQFASGVQIPFGTLDDVADEVEGRILLKVDIEGTEDVLFRHGEAFLLRHSPDILCEVLASSSTAPQLSALFKRLGYRTYQVMDTGLVERETITPHRRFKDWFFAKDMKHLSSEVPARS